MSGEIRLPKVGRDPEQKKQRISFKVNARLTKAQWTLLQTRLMGLKQQFPNLTWKVIRPGNG